MALIAVDVGGTKIAGGLFSVQGKLLKRLVTSVAEKKGDEIGTSIIEQIQELCQKAVELPDEVTAIGACVPGIYNPENGTVWAPNLKGWESYPLLDEISNHVEKKIPVQIDSDRSCYILGEIWQGNARGCKNAIFLAAGTGIGAGIIVDGRVLRGTGNSAGAVGWMALNRPYLKKYDECGCFEYHASGGGLVKVCKAYLAEETTYAGKLRNIPANHMTAKDIFSAYDQNDPMAKRVIGEAVEFWGMAVANLVSIFNPEKIILGGGVLDAAAPLLHQIKTEANRWAQPIAINEVSIDVAALGNDAGLYGAAYLALQAVENN
jgi:glucokinase